jgi:hypothetical protein
LVGTQVFLSLSQIASISSARLEHNNATVVHQSNNISGSIASARATLTRSWRIPPSSVGLRDR